MVVCLYVLALRQTGDLPRVYPGSQPKTAGIGSSAPATLKSQREWMDVTKILFLVCPYGVVCVD